jgi:hypothetical protein
MRSSSKEKVFKPPPIFVQGVKNIYPLTDLLNAKAKDNYEIKVLNPDQVKIQPLTSVSYMVIIKALEEKKTEFHTYKQKNQRAFRTVLKNMHYSTNIYDLKQEIEGYGHTVENIWNVTKGLIYRKFPMGGFST